jgi:F-box and leucine-rich repeat protein GRR1
LSKTSGQNYHCVGRHITYLPIMASSSAPRSALPIHPDGSSSSTPSRQPSQHASSSFRASPSPSTTSQSDDQEQDEMDEEEDIDDEDDFTDVGTSQFQLKERRNTLKAKGSAALAVSALNTNSSEHWQVMPADARNASAATLPHEILLHIFKYVSVNPPDLRRSLTVCKAWCLCGVELLWHRPSFQRISSLFKLIHIIRKPDQTFPYASYVRRLSLSVLAADLEDSLFGRLAVCTRLERLTLTGCTSITDDTIATVLTQTKHLVAADFSEVTQLTDKSIMAIAQNCPRLQGMNISGCKLVTSDAVALLAKNCKLLRRIKLCGCELIADSALTSLAQNCPVLLEVDLVNCPLITDTSVREMWKNSFHMRELRLAQCGNLTDLAFPAPHSSIQGVSSVGGHLASIQQQHNYYGSESAPASRGVSPFTHHDEATSQSQGQTDDTFPRTSSTPIQAPMHTHLRSIRMFDHLRVLDLTNCNTISDASIEGIVSNVPRIRNLILAKCTRLTNESVYSISRLGKNLHYLHLGHVSK